MLVRTPHDDQIAFLDATHPHSYSPDQRQKWLADEKTLHPERFSADELWHHPSQKNRPHSPLGRDPPWGSGAGVQPGSALGIRKWGPAGVQPARGWISAGPRPAGLLFGLASAAHRAGVLLLFSLLPVHAKLLTKPSFIDAHQLS